MANSGTFVNATLNYTPNNNKQMVLYLRFEDKGLKPPIEELLKNSPGRFALVITSARRAKDINSYFNQLGEGIGAYTPPQVQSLSRKPLTVAFEEIASGKVEVSEKE